MAQYTKDGNPISRGAQQVDANHVRHLLSTKTWWRGRPLVHQAGAWQIYTVDFMPFGAVYCTPQRMVAIEPETWRIVSSHLPAVAALTRYLMQQHDGGVGMGQLPMTQSVYAVAVAKASGTVQEEVDPTGEQMASVAQMAERLVVQAAGVVQHTDPQQAAIFLGNHAKIDEQLQEIEAEVARVRQLVDLAKETVLGSLV